MLWHISTRDGTAVALQRLFAALPENPGPVVYVNSTSAAALAAAARAFPHAERLRHFEYQRVTSVAEICAYLGNVLVVVEQLDAIVQEPGSQSYAELNRDLSHVMNTRSNVVFLDDWAYLDRYWLRREVIPNSGELQRELSQGNRRCCPGE